MASGIDILDSLDWQDSFNQKYANHFATTPKFYAGTSDTTIVDNVYKFLGCSVVDVSMNIGFNSSASSLSIKLVEDIENGDSFIEPSIPSVYAFSLPKGGVNQDLFVSDDFDFSPLTNFANVPFYFCGIVTNYEEDVINGSGRTIQVTLADPREILNGVQILTSGFSLSQAIGGNANASDPEDEDQQAIQVLSQRFRGVTSDNIIDAFGYHGYGFYSEKNENGMPWYKIKEAIEGTRVYINNIALEFAFSGSEFATPDWYRLNMGTIDLVGLIQAVIKDAGSDYLVLGKKISSDAMLVVISSSKAGSNELTGPEVDDFISDRSSIVSFAKKGKEYRNETTSQIIAGGLKNKNYVAYPTTYNADIHGEHNDEENVFQEDINLFPPDIVTRLFGGTTTLPVAQDDGTVELQEHEYKVETGGIFPFWGMGPNNEHPLIEPYVPLDHLVFDKDSDQFAGLKDRIPDLTIGLKSLTVRSVAHEDMFLEDDGTANTRQFAFIASSDSNYDPKTLKEGTVIAQNIKGLPLNTEVIRAVLMNSHWTIFQTLYWIYYPEIAQQLGFNKMNWNALRSDVLATINKGDTFRLEPVDPEEYWDTFYKTADGTTRSVILEKFHSIIYTSIKRYIDQYVGKQFLTILPRSIIMERIEQNFPVPTRIEKPEIEYTITDRAYWEDGVPTELQEETIRAKFEREDGRFKAMVLIDKKPTGNVNFNSNGQNEAMFQDLSPSDFRPNRLSEEVPDMIALTCSVHQLEKRPDLGIVTIPGPIYFDPTRNKFNKWDRKLSAHLSRMLPGTQDPFRDDEVLVTRGALFEYFWRQYQSDSAARGVVTFSASQVGEDKDEHAVKVFYRWSEQLATKYAGDPKMFYFDKEIVMDLKAVIIPLTSRWVSYGPWYYGTTIANGKVGITQDSSLVPWNFTDGMTGLETAGAERLARTRSTAINIDKATVSVAGLPEFGPGYSIGRNGNLVSMGIRFGFGGVTTSYNFSTYSHSPGTYRKSDMDQIRTFASENKPTINPVNLSFVYDILNGGQADARISALGQNRFGD